MIEYLRTLIAHARFNRRVVRDGNSFPPEYKVFPYEVGDLLVNPKQEGKLSIVKITKIDRIPVMKGQSINIQGQRFISSEDDWLLIVSAVYGRSEFATLDEAIAAARSRSWTVHLGHVPNRAPGACSDMARIGREAVTKTELRDHKRWLDAFVRGEAGVF